MTEMSGSQKNIELGVKRGLAMKELIESCRKAIEESRCLGCSGLGDKNYQGDLNCKYSKVPTVQESITQIKQSLGIQEKMKL